MQLDHVVLGVADLDEAAHQLGRRFGLTALPGGRHPGWGTANRIVPLGSCYLELATVVDAAEAAASAFGRWVTSMLSGGPALGWAVRTSDLSAVAARLGLTVADGSRTTASGSVVRWRIAGVAEAAAEPSLPFFIEWGDGIVLPGRTPVTHASGAASLTRLAVGGGSERLAALLGGEVATVEAVEGPRRVLEVTLSVDGATVDLPDLGSALG